MKPQAETRKRVKELRATGLSAREIARALNLTTQAVYYHLGRLEKDASR